MTVKPCNRPVVGGHRLGQMEFIDVFSFILTRLISPSGAEADVRYVETKTLIL